MRSGERKRHRPPQPMILDFGSTKLLRLNQEKYKIAFPEIIFIDGFKISNIDMFGKEVCRNKLEWSDQILHIGSIALKNMLWTF